MEILRADNELFWCKRIAAWLQNQTEIQVFQGRERQLWDRSRIDLLTDTLALEVDWAKKWAEAVGQCMWYCLNSARSPGIVLLMDDLDADARYIYRCRTVCVAQGIALWIVDTKKDTIDIDGTRYSLAPPLEIDA